MKPSLVSIIMPLYNSALYLAEAIESILSQTYENWELIIVDDCSIDSSLSIAKSFKDPRIHIVCHSDNQGAAMARNTALEFVNGRYIAYMDSDDVWLSEKLEIQIAFMRKHHIGMCFTGYETIEADGSHRNYVKVPDRIDYKGFLKNTVTCSHTIMFDLECIEVAWLKAPHHDDYDFPEDMAVWLQVLKNDVIACGCNQILAKNRKHDNSRSSKKLKAVQRTWNQYRRGENLGRVYSAYCLFWQLTHAIMKRI